VNQRMLHDIDSDGTMIAAMNRLILSGLVAVLLSIGAVPRAAAAIYVVNDLGDAPDAAPGDNACATSSGTCTLRAVIQEANARPGQDVAHFTVTGVIAPATELPAITGSLLIAPPTDTLPPALRLSGKGVLSIGLDFAAGSDLSLLRGFQIDGFRTAAVRVNSPSMVIGDSFLGPVAGGLPNGVGAMLLAGPTFFGLEDMNIVSGNTSHGILASGTQQIIQGNRIGTTADGAAALPNGGDGIHFTGPNSGATIGSFGAPARSNVIAYNGGHGIYIAGSTGARIQRNGIARNGLTGVTVAPSSTGVVLVSNSINENGGLGIDLGGDGVTPNDSLDADAGANDLQNFPVITSAAIVNGNTVVTGTLHSTPSTPFTIELVGSPAADLSGDGEGARFLAQTVVTTDASGNATFTITAGPADPVNPVLTATATSLTRGTSEFSAAAGSTAPIPTLSQWSLLALGAAFLSVALLRLK
jgi:hypothetical protein